MTRSQKIKLAFIFVLALIIALGSVTVKLYKEKVYWQEDSALNNYNHWSEIYLVADKLSQNDITREFAKEMYGYVNAKIFSNVTYPPFDGKSPYTFFLNTYYISLMQDIAYNEDLTDEKRKEAISIFKNANTELKAICKKVLDKAENKKERIELREVGSKLYGEVEQEIIDYCNKYGDEISRFNSSY